MRVLIVHPADPSSPVEGGGVRYVLELYRYLAKKGVSVTLIGSRFSDRRFGNLGTSFVPIANGKVSSWIFLSKLFLKGIFYDIPSSTIIHTCRLDFMLPFIIFRPRNPKVVTSDEPLVYAKLNYPNFLFELVKFVYQVIEEFCFRWAISILITDARTAKEYYEKRYPWLSTKIRVIPTSGVNLSKFKPMNRIEMKRRFGVLNNKVVIFVGRIAKVKRLDFLIESFTLVRQKVPESKLMIVGRGESWLEIQRLVEDLDLKDDVVFTGELNPDKIPEILNCADVLALSSIAEGSPTVVREAIACGVPVVTTDVGDVRRIIKNELVGSIVNMDESEYAGALINFLSLGEIERMKVEKECLKVSKELSLENVFERILDVYRLLEKSCTL